MLQIMKKLLQTLVIISFSFLLGSSSLFAQDEEKGFAIDVYTGFHTTYLWRGIDYFQDYSKSSDIRFSLRPAFTPEVTFTTPLGIYFDIWASIAILERESEEFFLEAYDEFDFTLGYATGGSYGDIDMGLVYYHYIGGYSIYEPVDEAGEPIGGATTLNADIGPDFEIYFSYAAPVIFAPTVGVSVDEETNFYLSGNLGYDFEVSIITISPNLTGGAWLRSRAALDRDPAIQTSNWGHLDINVPVYFGIGDITLDAGVTASLRFFDQDFKDANPDEPFLLIVANIGATYSLGY